MNASAAVGGPPVSPYAVNTGWSVRESQHAALYGVFVNALSLAANGAPRLAPSVWASLVAAMAAGAAMGRAPASRVPERHARRLVLLPALAGGMSVLAKGLWELREG